MWLWLSDSLPISPYARFKVCQYRSSGLRAICGLTSDLTIVSYKLYVLHKPAQFSVFLILDYPSIVVFRNVLRARLKRMRWCQQSLYRIYHVSISGYTFWASFHFIDVVDEHVTDEYYCSSFFRSFVTLRERSQAMRWCRISGSTSRSVLIIYITARESSSYKHGVYKFINHL